jgi:hypothetical protein
MQRQTHPLEISLFSKDKSLQQRQVHPAKTSPSSKGKPIKDTQAKTSMTTSMAASMATSSKNQDQDRASRERASRDHASRLYKKYIALEFKSDPSDPQDHRREDLFKRLVLHHLLQHRMYTAADWNNEAGRDKPIAPDNDAGQYRCIYNFLRAYSHALWPSYMVERHHLHIAKVRSWLGSHDGFGSSPDSPLGVFFKRYVDVLLEGGLVGAVVEDPEALVAGIRSVVVGADIPATTVVIKAGDVSEGDVAIKTGDASEGDVVVAVGDVEDVIMGGC